MSEIKLDYNKRKKSSKDLLDELDELDQAPMISSYRPKKEPKSKIKEMEEANEGGDDWLQTISTFKREPIKGRKNRENPFEYMNGKKKKKKKKEKEGTKDYNVEFEPEMALIKNLLADQNRFVDSLQKRYDILESTKSSARGVGKFTTDLISAISQSRGISRQLVTDMVSLKKTIADLNMKEKKENAAALDGGDDLNNFSATFLKNLISKGKEDAFNYGDDAPVEGTDSDIFSNISEELADSDRSPDIDTYLKYESRDVKLVAYVNKETDEWELKAVASDGEILDDYPIPYIEHMEINRSTELASDEFHTKYPIVWV